VLNPFTHRKILKKGVPGTARIVSMSMPESGASSQNIAMTLQVFVPNMNPYEVEDQWMVNHKDTLGFGMELPVKVDPDKPEKVAIDWEAARASHAAETTARRQALAAQGPVGGAVGAPAVVPGAGGIQDPLAGGATPTLDLRNDPELRAKLEQVLGRELTPGSTQHIDTSSDPALAMQIMQVVQQHNLEKMGMAQPQQPTSQGDSGDALSKLERLAALRDSGALTDAEFEAEKKQLLGDI
jgi:hypothetical protein